MAEIDLSKYRWAAVKGGRKALRMYGKNSSLSNDDADGEAHVALSLCQRTFDAEKGRFGCYVKRAAFNAVRRICLKHLREPIAEIPEGVASASGDFEEWLCEDTSRVKVLGGLLDPDKTLAVLKRTRRVWLTVPKIAAKVKISERKARRLCEQARIPAVQVGREWFALSREVTAWRSREIRKAYQTDGARRVAALFGVSKQCVQVIACNKPAKTISRRQKPLDVDLFGEKNHGKRAKAT